LSQHPSWFIENIENLCGRLFDDPTKECAISRLESTFKTRTSEDEFSYRQLNEVLLLLNERIVTKGFFKFLAGLGTGEPLDTIQFGQFGRKVHEFRKLAMLEYGSFRFAYNWLSTKEDPASLMAKWLKKPAEYMAEFEKRKSPLCEVDDIRTDHLHFIGYYSGDSANKNDVMAARKVGRQNFDTYLTWDYLDVYVATSMRRPFEFQAVNQLCREVFGSTELQSIGVRYFDPTLNFHEDSIAKSLIEGLMLKRAKCTLYLAQESDTMGKDSELAATLAQGKPVIAYVPQVDDMPKRCKQLRGKTLDELMVLAKVVEDSVGEEDSESFSKYAEEMSRIAELAGSEELKGEIKEHAKEYDGLLGLVAKYEKAFYDDRAKKLKYSHPLRFQMHLETGVANGVLVVRTPDQCKQLIYNLLTGGMEFDILSPEDRPEQELEFGLAQKYNYLLVERMTRSAYRVVTTDEKLTTSFWSLYKRVEK